MLAYGELNIIRNVTRPCAGAGNWAGYAWQPAQGRPSGPRGRLLGAQHPAQTIRSHEIAKFWMPNSPTSTSATQRASDLHRLLLARQSAILGSIRSARVVAGAQQHDLECSAAISLQG